MKIILQKKEPPILHLALHFLVPAVVVALFFRKDWKWAYGIMVATMLVDVDHVLADPMYDPGRCSIGTHPLHGPVPIAGYGLMCFFPKSRYLGIGLVIHMFLDALECQRIAGTWMV